MQIKFRKKYLNTQYMLNIKITIFIKMNIITFLILFYLFYDLGETKNLLILQWQCLFVYLCVCVCVSIFSCHHVLELENWSNVKYLEWFLIENFIHLVCILGSQKLMEIPKTVLYYWVKLAKKQKGNTNIYAIH